VTSYGLPPAAQHRKMLRLEKLGSRRMIAVLAGVARSAAARPRGPCASSNRWSTTSGAPDRDRAKALAEFHRPITTRVTATNPCSAQPTGPRGWSHPLGAGREGQPAATPKTERIGATRASILRGARGVGGAGVRCSRRIDVCGINARRTMKTRSQHNK